MKLNPPASSSDLDLAREIARRLHQRRRRDDRSTASAATGHEPLAPPAPPPRRAGPPADVAPPAAPIPPEPPVSAPAAAPPVPPPEPELAAPAPFEAETPPPPSWDEAPVETSGPAEDPFAAFGSPDPETEVAEDAGIDVAMDDAAAPDAAPEELASMEAAPPEADPSEEAVSPEEMVGAPGAPSFEELPETYDTAGSPFDVELDEEGAPAGEPSPPTWDDIVESCLALASAQGAMLVDPAGQVFAARGEWPAPGPEAIAAKLVATLERTLKDAPTRSISAPLMGRHLTAWRVPLTEGLVTAAFIGEAPVPAESRPSIDAEIHRGAGA
jgi:hypothetical protein